MINYKNLRYNISSIKKAAESENKGIIAVVKNNAYNTDINIVLKELFKKGIRDVAVSNVEEAIYLAENYKLNTILILYPVNVTKYKVINKYKNIHITINNQFEINEYVKQHVNIPVHININTGFNVFGFTNISNSVINDLKKINTVGIMTHYSNSENNEDITARQYNLWKSTLLKFNDFSFKYIHTENTGAFLNYKFIDGTHIRVGAAFYNNFESDKLTLKNALIFHSHISHIEHVFSDFCSYGSYVTPGTRIGVIYINMSTYANFNIEVKVNDKFCKVISKNMSFLIVELSENDTINNNVDIIVNDRHLNLYEIEMSASA